MSLQDFLIFFVLWSGCNSVVTVLPADLGADQAEAEFTEGRPDGGHNGGYTKDPKDCSLDQCWEPWLNLDYATNPVR